MPVALPITCPAPAPRVPPTTPTRVQIPSGTPNQTKHLPFVMSNFLDLFLLFRPIAGMQAEGTIAHPAPPAIEGTRSIGACQVLGCFS
jgi:hypothetical protein